MPDDDEIMNETTDPDASDAQPVSQSPTAQPTSKKSRRARTTEEEVADEQTSVPSPVPHSARPVITAAAKQTEQKMSSSTAHPMRFNLKPRKRR